MDRSRLSLPGRVVLAFVAVEALFKLLVGYSYLDLAGARTAAERHTALVWFVAVALPFTAVFFVALIRLLAPIRRWNREHRAGAVADATLQAAGAALYRLPRRVAWLWTGAWAGTFVVLLAAREVTCVAAGALFFVTMITGPQPIAGGVAFWLAAPSMRRVSLLARQRAIPLCTPALPLRRRLATFGLLTAIAPTTYVASFAFSAQVLRLSIHDMILPIVMVGLAIVAFAVISAWLTTASVTDVVASMAAVIHEVSQGDVSRVARVPHQVRDEVGGLAVSINEMIDRLERTAAERAAISESLEALNQALERRVLERTMRLHEANAVLKAEIEARAKVEIELRHAQKLESVGRLAAGIAHEINTPIQFVSDSMEFVSTASADLLALIGRYQAVVRAVRAGALEAADGVEAAEREADLEYIAVEIPSALSLARDGLDRIKEIVRSMKTFAHHDQDMRDADLNQAIRSTLTIARHEYRYDAEIDCEFGDIPLVHCHAGEINQVVLNLLVNATHAIADARGDGNARGRIGVRTAVDGDDVLIAISDTGGGIPEHIRHRIFDPFFTTKDVNRGTGQGLAIARSVIADKHGGSLTFTTEVGKGSTFTIRLPIRGRHSVPAEDHAAPGAAAVVARPPGDDDREHRGIAAPPLPSPASAGQALLVAPSVASRERARAGRARRRAVRHPRLPRR